MKEQYEQLALAPTSQAAFTAMLSSYKRFLKNKQTKKSLKLNKQKSKKHNLKKKGGRLPSMSMEQDTPSNDTVLLSIRLRHRTQESYFPPLAMCKQYDRRPPPTGKGVEGCLGI